MTRLGRLLEAIQISDFSIDRVLKMLRSNSAYKVNFIDSVDKNTDAITVEDSVTSNKLILFIDKSKSVADSLVITKYSIVTSKITDANLRTSLSSASVVGFKINKLSELYNFLQGKLGLTSRDKVLKVKEFTWKSNLITYLLNSFNIKVTYSKDFKGGMLFVVDKSKTLSEIKALLEKVNYNNFIVTLNKSKNNDIYISTDKEGSDSLKLDININYK